MNEEDNDYLKASDVFEEGVLRKAVSCPIIRDRFTSLEAVSQAIKLEGVKECGLILGIDYTLSNRMQGQKTFGGKSLHDVSSPVFNPYQQIICIFGETLESFDDDGMIPVFGFGDAKTKGESVFSLKAVGDCKGFDEVLNTYNMVTPTIKMSGPTNLAPLIKKAIEICKETEKYHILVIAADGQVTDEVQTKEALVEASKFPLSIVMIGVGDGPWETMEEFDDDLPERNFDNFQFVNFHEVMSSNARNPQAALALHALMEIPDQYKAIKELGLLKL
ncbi:hypothetical protein CHS0354_032202 [Potamilus streckersoni]|uniref:VWFA domain-containing protein n=1 Tax=Potamilus streckersoni TaxID=2493646 RepID=A0AAE0TH39_9BIVA|nr:hypothetical protein CHS0354_032202 [Potamilus streckersoni]